MHNIYFLLFVLQTFSGCLQSTVALMGYGPEDKNTVLELTYNYGVKEYDKGDGYGQVSALPLPESMKNVSTLKANYCPPYVHYV